MEGLEPTRLTAPDPKSGMATNYITSANEHCSFFLVSANINTFSFLNQENSAFFDFFKFFNFPPSFSLVYLLLLHL